MADQPEYREWQVPASTAAEDKVIGWVNEACEEGMAWCRSQRGYPDWRRSLNILASRMDLSTDSNESNYRSRVSTNRLKRNIREITGTLAKLRPIWGYYSDNKLYSDRAEMLNKVVRFWYLNQMVDRSVKRALDFSAATGLGWLHPVYRRSRYGTGRGDIQVQVYGAPSVLPVQLPESNDWQEAYAVTILKELPVAMAHAMFPTFQNRLRPTSSRYWYMNDGVRKATTGNWMARAFGRVKRTAEDTALSDLLIPIRYTYILDLAINTTGTPNPKSGTEIPMGEFGASWSYKVPYLGQQIQVGLDSVSGKPLHRTADENDARLYPYRRLIISTDTVKLYDGPSFDWHGMFPGVAFCLDAWPWEPLGFSLIRDGFELQQAINEIARGNMDKVRSQLNMSLAYDINSTTKGEAERFDPMQPRGRIGYDGAAIEGTPFTPVIPPEVLRVEPESMALMDKFESTMDSQQAIHDVIALAKLRAVGSMDDIEKIVEANGPIVEDMSRSMEPPMRDLGVMVKYDIMQYYTTPRVMNIVGPDKVVTETFDYDPASLVPSHVPGEDPERPSNHNASQRARILADNLDFYIMPNTLHEIHQMTMKLGLIQLRKAQVKIDSQTIAEAWNVPNYGQIDGNTVLERFKQEQEDDLIFGARMKEVAEAIGLLQPGTPGQTAPGKKQEGRPPTGQNAPALKSKDGGARSTVTESK